MDNVSDKPKFPQTSIPEAKAFWHGPLKSFLTASAMGSASLDADGSVESKSTNNGAQSEDEDVEAELNDLGTSQVDSETHEVRKVDVEDGILHDSKLGSPTSHAEEEALEIRKAAKTRFNARESQQKRRTKLLLHQKERRDDILEKIRHLEGDSAFSDSEAGEDEDFVQIVKRYKTESDEVDRSKLEVEHMDTTGGSGAKTGKGKRRGLKNKKKPFGPCRAMLSEWLTQKPEDFEENWVGVLCPAGKRCIVVASRGKTFIFSRTDEYMGVYQSLLPGGRRFNDRDSEANRTKGVTILDCIWVEEAEIFYVLDLICWNSYSCNNCDKEYRQFFMTSKLAETPSLMQKSSSNPFPFLPLPAFSSDLTSEIMMTSLPIFKQYVDGVLFFHKQSFYYPGVNPLCLWVYLTEMEDKLQISVSPELLERQKIHPKRASVANCNPMEV